MSLHFCLCSAFVTYGAVFMYVTCRVDTGRCFKRSWYCIWQMQCWAETGAGWSTGRDFDDRKEVCMYWNICTCMSVNLCYVVSCIHMYMCACIQYMDTYICTCILMCKIHTYMIAHIHTSDGIDCIPKFNPEFTFSCFFT